MHNIAIKESLTNPMFHLNSDISNGLFLHNLPVLDSDLNIGRIQIVAITIFCKKVSSNTYVI